jgi:hypothetical protein
MKRVDKIRQIFGVWEFFQFFVYGECRKNFNDTGRFLVEHYPNVDFTKL